MDFGLSALNWHYPQSESAKPIKHGLDFVKYFQTGERREYPQKQGKDNKDGGDFRQKNATETAREERINQSGTGGNRSNQGVSVAIGNL